MRRLLFFPDHYVDPLWDFETGGIVSLDEVGLPNDLRDEVRAWAAAWSGAGLDAGKSAETMAEIDRRGQALWRRVYDELRGRVVVGFATFPPTGREVQWSPDRKPVAASVTDV